jgi:hypothetical protein
MNPKVRSVTLDRWTPDLVEAMERAGGNASVNACYEALLPHTQTQAKTDRCVRVCVCRVLCVYACVYVCVCSGLARVGWHA